MPMSTRRVDRGRRVVGVQRGEHEVAGQRGLHGDLAVSWSRISPTRTMSGSWRRIERSAEAKVRPAFALICTWLMPARRYSTGSSTVMMLTSGRLSWLSVA